MITNGSTPAVVSHITAGRGQIGTSLSFHLFFAVLGVGLSLMLLVAHGMHLRAADAGVLLIALCASAAGFPIYRRSRARLTRRKFAPPAIAKTADSAG